MHKVRVGVLRGGPSSEHEVSLKTGETAIRHIPQDYYEIEDIFISLDGQWHRQGLPVTPTHAISRVDVIFNALHGHFGEDGKVQHILETHGIPFTGSGSFASAVGMNKVISKNVLKKEKIKTPQYRVIEDKKDLDKEKIISLFRAFPLPLVVKPASAGSSIGVSLVKDFESFEQAIDTAFKYSSTVLVEEYIPGIEATVAVIDKYRDQDIYVLPAVEIRPKEKTFFDYDAKYGGMSEKIVPANFSFSLKADLESIAGKVHQALGLRHYSRTDFIISPTRGIYVLELNTLPGLTEESSLPKALETVGSSLSHFFHHILQLALERK